MKAKKSKVIKNWLKFKSVWDIQIFLGFANSYWQFIQSFSKIATLLTSILKTNGLSDKPISAKNDSSKPASSRKNINKSIFAKNNGNNKINRFGNNGIEYAKKSRKSKAQKLLKSQKLLKLGKKITKKCKFT